MNGTPTHFVFSKLFDFQLKKKTKFIYTFLTKLPKSYGFVYDFYEICLLKR